VVLYMVLQNEIAQRDPVYWDFWIGALLIVVVFARSGVLTSAWRVAQRSGVLTWAWRVAQRRWGRR
jgi:hypothetical protein